MATPSARHTEARSLRPGLLLAASVETTYGEQSLQRYAEEVGVDHSTLEDYRRVAVAIRFPSRNGNLSWSHHRAVAALDDPAPWLQMAARQGWSVARLRTEIEDPDGRRTRRI